MNRAAENASISPPRIFQPFTFRTTLSVTPYDTFPCVRHRTTLEYDTMSDTVRHPDCPNVHLGGAAVCRECRRLYERDARSSRATSETEDSSGGSSAAVDVESDAVPESDDITSPDLPPPSKAECFEVARSVFSNAQKCHNWRERKKLSDPDYLRREAARMKALRERLK